MFRHPAGPKDKGQSEDRQTRKEFMEMNCSTIMAVTISKRIAEAVKVQQALTKHGCIIRLRVGLHETGGVCADDGLVILNLCGTKKDVAALKADLNKIKGVKAKTMAV
jgi:metal-responsive CopG/Arc/MetJ family transcriptional regulator